MVLKDLYLYTDQDTQNTYRSLVAEVVDMYGIPIRYLPKTITANKSDPFGLDAQFGKDVDISSNSGLNEIYGEDVNISYNDSVPMKAILENYNNYDGTHNLFSKFGFSMEDELQLSIETSSWRSLMSRCGYDFDKPAEGDLILFELAVAKNGRPQIFEISYCNESATYFAFGQLMVFKINCTVWEYSHEKLNTGDIIVDNLNIDINSDTIRNEIGDNEKIQEKSEEISKFDPDDPFGDEFDN